MPVAGLTRSQLVALAVFCVIAVAQVAVPVCGLLDGCIPDKGTWPMFSSVEGEFDYVAVVDGRPTAVDTEKVAGRLWGNVHYGAHLPNRLCAGLGADEIIRYHQPDSSIGGKGRREIDGRWSCHD